MLAAIELINEIGLAGTSMSKIAKKAGVSAATIYVYFENKEDMIKKLFLTVKADMHQKLLLGIDGSLPTEAACKQLLKNYMNYLLRNKDYFLFFEQFINSPLIQKLCGEESALVSRPIREFFDKGKNQNVIKPIDTKLLFIYAFSPLIQIAKRHINGDFALDEQLVDEIIQMSWDSIKA